MPTIHILLAVIRPAQIALLTTIVCSVLPYRAWPQDAGKEGRLAYVEKSTKKVCQLTGEQDRQIGQPTLSHTQSSAGVVATDLGSSFEHRGKLFFLFGDTWGKPGARDAMAWTESSDPEKIALTFLSGADGKWAPLAVPGIKQGAFEVPSYGVSLDGKMYVVCTTDHTEQKTMGRSVLAVSHDDGKTFRQVYDLSADKFINVALWKVEPWLYIFGSGDYRKSSVCLARVELGIVERRDALRFFRGMSPDGVPRWSEKERDAVVLFQHDVVGELSVAYCEPVNRYVMLYNSSQPRGIVMRSAKQPWGPWSEPEIIFNPRRDNAFGQFMHVADGTGPNADRLSDANRENVTGGAYGPYLMSRYTTGEAGSCRIYYTMSTWNPYQVVIMQSDLRLALAESK